MIKTLKMKIIKSYAIITIILGLSYLGLSYTNNQQESEVQFTEQSDTTVTNEIAPKEEWSEILLGKWKFVHTTLGVGESFSIEGEAEYFVDGTFTRKFSFYIYKDFKRNEVVEPIESNLVSRMGGGYRGKYKLQEGIGWVETINANECKAGQSFYSKDEYKNYIEDICDYFQIAEFSSKNDLDFVNEIIDFNRKRIAISGINYKEGTDYSYAADRVLK